MGRNDLLACLAIIRDHQAAVEVCGRAISAIDAQLEALGRPREIAVPLPPADDSAEDAAAGFVAGAIAGPAALLAVTLLVWVFGDVARGGDVSWLYPLGDVGTLAACAVGTGAAGSALLGASAREDARRAQEKYRADIASYQRLVRKDLARVQAEKRVSQALLHDRRLLVAKKREAQALAADACDVAGIHNKYRNLPAVATFYDYFDTQICDRLSGARGAYARYETEARLDRIVTTLDRISAKMDLVLANQRALAEAVSSIDATSARMCRAAEQAAGQAARIAEAAEGARDGIARIEANAEVSRWCAEQTRLELAHRRWLESDLRDRRPSL